MMGERTPFQVDEILILRNPLLQGVADLEAVSVNYRGPAVLADGRPAAVVWTGVSQITVPVVWLARV
jgi:hypothetical protein